MALRLLEHVWHPDRRDNADWFAATSETALLLDGATPRGAGRVSEQANDTVWLVRRFVELFLERGEPDVDRRVERAREQLHEDYARLCQRAAVAPEEAPFACLAVAHESEGGLELRNMGDLTTLIRGGASGVSAPPLRRFGESAVRELDRRALALLEEAIRAGVEPHAARSERIWPQLVSHRALRNVLAGYEVLEPAVASAGRMQRLRCDRGEARALLMMSDGFYRLVDTFGRYTDATLLEAVEHRGLSPLLEELRQLELDDPECVAHPRFKRHDDATALWLQVSGD